jgi:hypothetical protein
VRTERLSIPAAKYEWVRADPHRFLVVPGHENAELERVVERAESYVVVQKDEPEAKEVAEETDPRS